MEVTGAQLDNISDRSVPGQRTQSRRHAAERFETTERPFAFGLDEHTSHSRELRKLRQLDQ